MKSQIQIMIIINNANILLLLSMKNFVWILVSSVLFSHELALNNIFALPITASTSTSTIASSISVTIPVPWPRSRPFEISLVIFYLVKKKWAFIYQIFIYYSIFFPIRQQFGGWGAVPGEMGNNFFSGLEGWIWDCQNSQFSAPGTWNTGEYFHSNL